MKKSFSLIELIFVIVIIGIIASVAIPKLMNTKNNALATSLKQDISTVLTSVQAYHLSNSNIDKISDAVNVNSARWEILDTQIKYIENSEDCIIIALENDKIVLKIDENAGNICAQLVNDGIESLEYELK